MTSQPWGRSLDRKKLGRSFQPLHGSFGKLTFVTVPLGSPAASMHTALWNWFRASESPTKASLRPRSRARTSSATNLPSGASTVGGSCNLSRIPTKNVLSRWWCPWHWEGLPDCEDGSHGEGEKVDAACCTIGRGTLVDALSF